MFGNLLIKFHIWRSTRCFKILDKTAESMKKTSEAFRAQMLSNRTLIQDLKSENAELDCKIKRNDSLVSKIEAIK